jgi:hypothetical protein
VGIKVEIVSVTGRRADCSLPFNGKIDLALKVLGYDDMMYMTKAAQMHDMMCTR